MVPTRGLASGLGMWRATDVAVADLKVIAPGLTIKTSEDDPTAGMGEAGDLGSTSTLVASSSVALDVDVEAEAARVRTQEAQDSEAMGKPAEVDEAGGLSSASTPITSNVGVGTQAKAAKM
ncbi:hypothetical protein FRC07_013545 [Ceratobasidium sp. 392]|nr:hypothetical protein FRC07_013545 [Ceratobasidium sp. 392]